MPDYFTLAELRALPQMSDATTYTDARCEAAAAWIVAIIEREVRTSFVRRTYTETYDGGGTAIVLDQPFAQTTAALTATEDGVAVTDTLRVSSGVLRRFDAGEYTPLSWATGVGNISVTYEAGYSATPPSDIKEAALAAARWRLLATNSNAEMNARQTQVTNDMGGTISFTVAGPDRPTGYPEVDAVIVGWRDRLNVFGFA